MLTGEKTQEKPERGTQAEGRPAPLCPMLLPWGGGEPSCATQLDSHFLKVAASEILDWGIRGMGVAQLSCSVLDTQNVTIHLPETNWPLSGGGRDRENVCVRTSLRV